jgi:molybdopterin-containing oxidoreductase family iron-sulfur binding subunit
VAPGQAPDTVTLHLGYGRRRAGRVGDGVGVDAYGLRTSANPWSAPGLSVTRTGTRYPLASTQHHFSLEGRDLVHSTTPAALAKADAHGDGHDSGHGAHGDLSMYPAFPYPGYAWGMAVDLSTCVGCNACVVACVSENNIPVVGKDQVARGREMHWMRIDRYYEGGLDNPVSYNQPMFCQHCELAPCEVVCPVNATVHDSEGLNAMVYNRCVGTRYCSNNCPYKVRRFNFTLYNDPGTPTLKMLQNPDVTVRSRGVMEKCTYCVQRINQVRIQSARENRRIRDGELLTACQQACPADALVFGDINDPNSRVAALKREPRHYSVLGELGTKPRTTYLANLKNPNPELA